MSRARKTGANKISEKIRISFEGSAEDGASPFVVIYNPLALGFALSSQVARFGLATTGGRESSLSGRLKGKREDFTQMIQSYGNEVEIVPVV